MISNFCFDIIKQYIGTRIIFKNSLIIVVHYFIIPILIEVSLTRSAGLKSNRDLHTFCRPHLYVGREYAKNRITLLCIKHN